MDPSGNVWENGLDSQCRWSAAKFLAAPSWKAAGYLIWDISATFILFVPGSYVKKGLNAAGKIKKLRVKVPTKVTELRQGKYLVVGSYSALRKICRGAKKRKEYRAASYHRKAVFESPQCITVRLALRGFWIKSCTGLLQIDSREEFSYSKRVKTNVTKRISYSRMVKIVNRGLLRYAGITEDCPGSSSPNL